MKTIMTTQTPAPRTGLPGVLWSFRREFMVVGVFSMVVNLLMLTPTLYMLQVFDRVMLSQSLTTLELSGQLSGDIGALLEVLDSRLGEARLIHISCALLIRVDFIAAWLSWA